MNIGWSSGPKHTGWPGDLELLTKKGTVPFFLIGNDCPDAGKTACLLPGGAQHTDHLPDKNNAMKKQDKNNRRDQREDAIRDIGRQRIAIRKQNQSPDQDQVDAQRE